MQQIDASLMMSVDIQLNRLLKCRFFGLKLKSSAAVISEKNVHRFWMNFFLLFV